MSHVTKYGTGDVFGILVGICWGRTRKAMGGKQGCSLAERHSGDFVSHCQLLGLSLSMIHTHQSLA